MGNSEIKPLINLNKRCDPPGSYCGGTVIHRHCCSGRCYLFKCK
nr:conotoxin precursor O1 [Conus ebraeus]